MGNLLWPYPDCKFYKMKKILVTGATGFVGNYVMEELLKQQLNVVATSTNIEKAKQFIWFDKVEYVFFDLNQFSKAENYHTYFHEPTHLIHLAWEGLPNYNESFHLQVNLPRHYQFIQNMVRHGLQNVTVAGTCLEYGMKEGMLKEQDTAAPITAYAQAKNELRIQLEALAQLEPYLLKWVRLFYMYGKGQSTKSLLSQLEQALEKNEISFNMSGGEQVRDYLPVEHVATNIVQIALQDKVTGIINCSSNQPIQVRDFVLNYLRENRKSIHLNLGFYPYPSYEPMHFWGDNSKLQSIIKDQQTF